MVSFSNCPENFDLNGNYRKLLRFADPELRARVDGYVATINNRIEQERLAEEERRRAREEEARQIEERRRARIRAEKEQEAERMRVLQAERAERLAHNKKVFLMYLAAFGTFLLPSYICFICFSAIGYYEYS